MKAKEFVAFWNNAVAASEVADILGLSRRRVFALANRARGLGYELSELSWELVLPPDLGELSESDPEPWVAACNYLRTTATLTASSASGAAPAPSRRRRPGCAFVRS